MMRKKHKYLIACSGGPDSMALLDILKGQYKVIVAHVNYHKRESALRDEMIVRNYCEKYDLPFFKKDVYFEGNGNFQDYARNERYAFFKTIYDECKCDGLCVAHHFDDYLETFLMQKKRGIIPSFYGIQEETTLFGMKVYRPLLNKEKSELIDYCDQHQIEYGIDESNFSDDYLRNEIRHSIIERMSHEEKQALYKESLLLNQKRQEELKDAKAYLKNRNALSIEEFLAYKQPLELLRLWLYEDLSLKYLNELYRQIQESESLEIEIQEKTLFKEYGNVGAYLTPSSYSYVYNEITFVEEENFKIVEEADSFHSCTVSEDDFPLTIRSFKKGDRISMRYGHKKVSRFFIDQKIPSQKRKVWPIVLNAKNEVILVPRIGCDQYHYSTKPNLFVIE